MGLSRYWKIYFLKNSNYTVEIMDPETRKPVQVDASILHIVLNL